MSELPKEKNMMKNEKVRCKKIGINKNISRWECPKCGLVFECGDGNKTEMNCYGRNC